MKRVERLEDLKPGDRICRSQWTAREYFEYYFNIDDNMYGKDEDGCPLNIHFDRSAWLYWEPPKETVKMCPCFYKVPIFFPDKVFISNGLYANEKEAKKELGKGFISWPAIPNPDGSYDVPVKEESK